MVLGNPKSLSTTELHPSTGAALTSDNGGEAVATSMILRTLECRNVHSGVVEFSILQPKRNFKSVNIKGVEHYVKLVIYK